MFLKVIYPDGTAGMAKASAIGGMIKAEKIIAFYCSEGWVEVRRKSKTAYYGAERRMTNPQMFFREFNFDESVV